MNILLINPNREQMPWPTVPLGLCAVASGLRRAGHEVDLLDLTFCSDPRARTFTRVLERQPALVGITVRNIDNCNFEAPVFYLTAIRDAVIDSVRAAAPSATVIVGGSAVNIAPAAVLRFLQADAALVGEGEEALPAVVSAIERGASQEALAALPGLLLRDGLLPGTSPGERALVEDLDVTPSEAWRWVDLRRYAAHGAPYSVQTKRGCTQRCAYCVYGSIEGRRYRLRRPAAILEEIAEAVFDHGVRQIDFVDSTFNLPLEHAFELCDALASRAFPAELSTMGLNPAATSPALLRVMQRAGFRHVMCAAESASDVTLASLQKGYSRAAVVEAAAQLRRTGLKTFWFFIFGAPGETLATAQETLAFCEEHIRPDDMVLFTTGLRVYPGTALETLCRRDGWFAADDELLYPSWYLSPTVDLQQLYQLIVRAARHHPNWMINSETILQPRLAALLKGGFRLLGWKGPFWTHLPKLFRWTAALGARGRTLDAALTHLRDLRGLDLRHRKSFLQGARAAPCVERLSAGSD